MTPITMARPRILDGEKCFRMYFLDMGTARSIAKVKKQLGAEAINPNTGRVVTDMAIWWSIARWASNNFELSYRLVNEAAKDEGVFFTREQWKETLDKKVKLIVRHSEKGFERWQKRVGRIGDGKATSA